MGLDMFAHAVPVAKLSSDQEVDLEYQIPDGFRLAYWRKFNNLHGWMWRLYERKGGSDSEFNCNLLRLNSDDLDQLESDIGSDDMPPQEGFFFGECEDFDSDMADEIREFIKQAKEAIAAGKAVLYYAWW